MSCTAAALPAFTNALLPRGTIEPPCMFIAADLDTNITQQTSYSNIDPFAAARRHLILLPTAHTPMYRLNDIRSNLNAARHARLKNDRETAAQKYTELLGLLEGPVDQTSHIPLHEEIPNGKELFVEALFGSAGFSGPDLAAENIARLKRFIEDYPTDADPLNRVIAKLLKTFALVQYASSAKEPQTALYERALSLADEAIDEIPYDHEANDDIIFYGNLLSIEILARLLAHAHHRSDHHKEIPYIQKIVEAFTRIGGLENTPERLELIANYNADVAILLAKIGLWGRAMEIAGRQTGSIRKRLLKSPALQPVIDNSWLYYVDELAMKTKIQENVFIRHLLIAMTFAYSESLKQSAMWGGAGLLTGIGADFALSHGEHTTFVGMIGAILATAINRLRNGWKTPDALYASNLGTPKRTWQENATDVANFAITSGISSVPWLIPAGLADVGMDGLKIGWNTLCRAGDLYYQFGEWAVRGAPSLVKQETYTNLIDSASHMDRLDIAYQVYTRAAGALYAVNIFAPRKVRAFTERIAPLFLPGAIFLSADIGQAINNNKPWWDRVGQAGIVSIEILLMQLTTGLLPLENRSSTSKVFQSIAKVVNPGGKDSKYMLPLAGALLANVGSAMGGYMQKGVDPTLLPMALVGMQAAATTVGKLGITLTISGVLKRNLPIFTGLREAWQDSKGQPPHIRAYESFLGFVTGFNYPYGHNRLGRSGTWDLPGEMLRTLVGYDTPAGQLVMSATNMVSGNNISSATWPEGSGTVWERDTIMTIMKNAKAEELRKKVEEEMLNELKEIDAKRRKGKLTAQEANAQREELYNAENTQRRIMKEREKAFRTLEDFLNKSGKKMHPLHPLVPRASQWDSVWFARSIIRAGWPPTFPHMPNGHMYANLHQIINGGSDESIDQEQMDVLLQYVGSHANDPNNYEVLRPLIQTLAILRESKDHGQAIKEFFEANPALPDIFNIDLDDHKTPKDRQRYEIRRAVRKALDVLFEDYQTRTKGHTRLQIGEHDFDDVFIVHSLSPTVPSSGKKIIEDSEAEAIESSKTMVH
ncbi:MAG: DUF4200 domain-containing protein [Pseudomonadota bacterium]